MTPFPPLLQALGRDELLAIADHFSIPVADRRAKAPLLGAIARIRDERLGEALAGFARDRLKELRRELGLNDSGREKSAPVERLLASPSVLRALPEERVLVEEIERTRKQIEARAPTGTRGLRAERR